MSEAALLFSPEVTEAVRGAQLASALQPRDLAAPSPALKAIIDELEALAGGIDDSELRDEIRRQIGEILSDKPGAGMTRITQLRDSINDLRQQAANGAQRDRQRNEEFLDAFYELSASSQERVLLRSQVITSENSRDFLGSLMRSDDPPQVKEVILNDAQALLDGPAGRALTEEYNVLSEESRKKANIDLEVAEKLVKKHAEKVPENEEEAELQKSLKRAAELGSPSDAVVQKAMRDYDRGEASAVETNAVVEKANAAQVSRIAYHVPDAIKRLPSREQEIAAQMSPEDVVQRGAEVGMDNARRRNAQAYLKAQAQGKDVSQYDEATVADAAAYRVKGAAQPLAVFENIVEVAKAHEREMNPRYKGNERPIRYYMDLERRTQLVFDEIRNDPQYEGVTHRTMMSNIRNSLMAIDASGKDLSQLDEATVKHLGERADLNRKQSMEERMITGLHNILDGNINKAEASADGVGLRTSEFLEYEVGFNKGVADTVGDFAGDVLKGGAKLAIGARETIESAGSAVLDANSKERKDLVRGAKAIKTAVIDKPVEAVSKAASAAVEAAADHVQSAKKAVSSVANKVADTGRSIVGKIGSWFGAGDDDDDDKPKVKAKPKAALRKPAGNVLDKELKENLGVLNQKGWDDLVSGNGQKTFDKDRDGKVELHELKAVLARHGIKNMDQIDKNHDGNITGKELTNVMVRIRDKEGARVR